ncbi:unnamed protein product [Albugo candida]|uniref:Uncharacterized protein n=1 Tax=Albugo candida TaxID=65357 RepID=A0A024G5Q9_9STRA|nr:unnamed protein product [Albugo candida]|eukprot:CCI42097.1 unnamed protein product [Albugo candida]
MAFHPIQAQQTLSERSHLIDFAFHCKNRSLERIGWSKWYLTNFDAARFWSRLQKTSVSLNSIAIFLECVRSIVSYQEFDVLMHESSPCYMNHPSATTRVQALATLSGKT